MPAFTHLLSTLQVGKLALKNRAVMAPLTRCRAIEGSDHVPSDMMATYYGQRASEGALQIAEATMIAENESAFWTEPGAYSADQVEGWKKTTQAVHAKKGYIFLQLWHGGRQAVPENNNGRQPVSCSAIGIEGHKCPAGLNPTMTAIPYSVPRALELEEIPEIVAMFVNCAKNAAAAGFDGVEIHGANGYLLDQFLRTGTNKRTDKYGGSLENRARLLLEVVDAVAAVIGAGSVGVRLSPLNSYGGMVDEDPIGLTRYVTQQLAERKIAYVHLMRADFFQQQKGNIVEVARASLPKDGSTVLMTNMGYTPAEADASIAQGEIDCVAFGTLYLTVPDLVHRLELGKEVSVALMKPNHFYSHGPEGYIDYPTLEEEEAQKAAATESA